MSVTWKDIREKLKKRDRYYEVYDNPESFWTTLDSRIVAYTFNLPTIVGLPLRILYSIVGLSNRYEPMPIGNNERTNNLWKDKPDWLRYLLWKVRNPWEDLKKFYLGFANAESSDWYGLTDHFGFWLAKFKYIPFRIPFPYYKNEFDNGLELMLGWKSRGVLSFTVRIR